MNRFALILLFVCVSCCPKVYPPKVETKIVYRDSIVYVRDTAVVEIPKLVEKIVTKDTASYIGNEYAESYAAVSDGLLYHSLETKPQKIFVPVEIPVVMHDTIERESRTEYIDREVIKTVYPRSYWWLLGILLIMLLGLSVRLYLRFRV